MSVRVSLTERVSIEARGAVVDEQRFPGRQGRLVFAYLLAAHGRPVPRDELAEALWGDEPPATWEKALSVLASKLRALLAECGLDGVSSLTSAFGCYQLTLPAGSWIDVVAADEAATAAERSLAADEVEQARADASVAESLARRTFLPGEDSRWVEGKRADLRETLIRALDCLAEAHRLAGDPRAAVRAAEEVVELEPYRERGYRLLMEAQSAAGNDAEALRVYERCRRLLDEELGTYPSPETEAIYRRLLEAPTVAVGRPPFEGREGELAEEATREMARRWRRPARQTLIAATSAVAVVGLGVGVLLTRGEGSRASASIAPNSLGVIDSNDGQIAAEIPVGDAPGGVAAGSDAVWVSNTGEDTVSRIDPATNDVRQTIDVGGGPAGIAATPNAVWVANGLDATVSRIDPESNRVSQVIDVGNGPTGVAAGEGAVWVTNSTDGTVSRIDLDSGTVTGTYPAAPGASSIAVGFGRVWVVSPPSAKVVALDPDSGRIVDEIGVGVDPAAIGVGRDALWVTNRADGTVSKIEPRSGAVIGTTAVGRAPTGVAAGEDAVWVANSGDATMSRVDPSSVTVVKSIPLGNPPRDAVSSPGGTYVTVGASGIEHRGGTLRVVTVQPDSIDPALAYASESWAVLAVTNDGLVAFRKVGGAHGIQLVPDLAVSLPILTHGGMTYTFQLRPGIRYSDGRLVQPADFRRAIERVFELGSPGAPYYSGIIGTERCEKGARCDLSQGISADRRSRTVGYRLKAPDGDFLTKLAMPWASAVPVSTPARDIGARPVPATGPYRIVAYDTRAKVLRLARNPHFRLWSPDAQPEGFPDSIVVSWPHAFTNVAARARAVERGRADIAMLGWGPPLPKSALEQLAARYPARLRFATAFNTTYFFLKTSVPPFDDVRVRRAVVAAFDEEAFAAREGPQYAPSCRILPPNYPAYQSTCPHASRGIEDIHRARKQVEGAGAAGTRVTVWTLSPVRGQAEYIASLLRSIGFRAGVKSIAPVPDPSGYFTKVADPTTRAQIGFGGWVSDYPSAAGFIPPLLGCAGYTPQSPQTTTNLTAYCNPALDAKMTRASGLQATNPPAASLLWQRIEDELLAQAPLLPTVNQRNADFLSKRVGNYQYNPQWGVLLSQLWVK
jgi:peptide/nickel transport system substrate-binding protein